MTPPGATQAGQHGQAGSTPPAVSVCPLETLSRRADFLRAARAKRQQTPGFLLQARRRDADETPGAPIRVGYTCSRKIGNAVTRNRAKRRLREIARRILPAAGQPGWDYVLIGRPGVTVERDFAAMLDDLARALARLHADAA